MQGLYSFYAIFQVFIKKKCRKKKFFFFWKIKILKTRKIPYIVYILYIDDFIYIFIYIIDNIYNKYNNFIKTKKSLYVGSMQGYVGFEKKLKLSYEIIK